MFDPKKVESWATAINNVVGELNDGGFKEFTKDCP
jgi:hypothetical protein